MESLPQKTWLRSRPKSAYVYGPNKSIKEQNPDRTLHPPEIYHPIKFNESAQYFANNKVQTCKKIMMKYDK